jgi:hypothetical protein
MRKKEGTRERIQSNYIWSEMKIHHMNISFEPFCYPPIVHHYHVTILTVNFTPNYESSTYYPILQPST